MSESKEDRERNQPAMGAFCLNDHHIPPILIEFNRSPLQLRPQILPTKSDRRRLKRRRNPNPNSNASSSSSRWWSAEEMNFSFSKSSLRRIASLRGDWFFFLCFTKKIWSNGKPTRHTNLSITSISTLIPNIVVWSIIKYFLG